jgi:hypothetical protein
MHRPIPIFVFAFDMALLIAVSQAIFVTPFPLNIARAAKLFAGVLLGLSVASVGEVFLRKLSIHYISACMTLLMALTYWFIVLVIAGMG